jgi:hypothetical protein
MMAERTELIKAKREAEDGAIRTKTQISSAILAVLAGFSLQLKAAIGAWQIAVIAAVAVSLALTILFGIIEQRFASEAYQQQLSSLQRYYTKEIASYSDPPANARVRCSQKLCMIAFVVSMAGLASLIMLNLVT